MLSRPREGITQLTLNRPDRLNAIDDSLVDGLHTALDEVREDDGCRAVVLTGAGRAFCAGFDMRSERGAEFGAGQRRPVVGTLGGQTRLADLVRRLGGLRVPVVAAVNGAAAGGGFALALAADLRVAAPGAVFLVANVKLGLSGGEMGISYFLPRIVGGGRAADLMLTGRTIDAAEAVRWGLVTGVADDAVAAALDLAETVAANGAFGVQMTKELLDVSLGGADLDTMLVLENRTQVLASMTDEMTRAVASFRDRGGAEPGVSASEGER